MVGFKELVRETAQNMVVADLSSKKLFLDTFNLIKDNNVNNIKASINGLVDDAKEELGLDFTVNVKNRIINSIKLAGSWYGEKFFMDIEALHYYNIEDTVKVINSLKDLANNEQAKVTIEDVKRAKNQLSRIKNNGNNIDYNNDYADKIKDIKKEFSLFDVDGKIVQMEKSIEKLFEMLTAEQKESFKAYVNKLS